MTTLPLTHPGRHAVYTGRTTSWAMVAFSAASAVLVVFMGKESRGAWGDLLFVVPLVLVGLTVVANILTGSSVRATAGPMGFTIHWGIVGWPRCTYRLDEIDQAEVIDLPWRRVSWGFWWTPKRTNCTLRRGSTVQLSLSSGRTVVVTVPEPEAAVSAIQAAQGHPVA